VKADEKPGYSIAEFLLFILLRLQLNG